MPDEVVEAMRSASRSYIDMHELHSAAGQRLAELTGNEAAYATSGCAAALVLGTLGAITKGDPRLIVRMPEGKGLATEIVMHTVHRCPGDPGVEMGGGKTARFATRHQTFESETGAALQHQTAV